MKTKASIFLLLIFHFSYYCKGQGGCVMYPVVPITSPVCKNSTTTFTLTSYELGRTYDWYTTSTGGTPFHQGYTYDNPNTQANTIFYVQPRTQAIRTTYNYTGTVQYFTVPAGVTSVSITAYGARGGDAFSSNTIALPPGKGGAGGIASGNLSVMPGQILQIRVGGSGSIYTGGYNGGGNGGKNLGSTEDRGGGGGGGASDVRTGNFNERVIVAAGGGGGGRAGCEGVIPGGNGGVGGGDNGQDGAMAIFNGIPHGGGKGGNTNGEGGLPFGCGGALGERGGNSYDNIGGNGGAGRNCCCSISIPSGGGGGGGYFGGGGGAGGSAGTESCLGDFKGGGGGGAGGTSYIGGVTDGTMIHGANTNENGYVVISYDEICLETARVSTTVEVYPDERVLSSPTNDFTGVTETILSSEKIIATNKIFDNSNITYKAPKSITLLPGFKTEILNGYFVGRIANCND